MKVLQIDRLRKLKRRGNDLFLGTATLSQIRQWNVKNASSQLNSEFVYLYSEEITVIKEENSLYEISIKDGYLITELPKVDLEDECPILITNNSPQKLIIDTLLDIEVFKTFIEIKSPKISKNSTKVMTLSTLENIVSLVFNKCTLDKTAEFLIKLKIYINNVISQTNQLKIYSVKEIQELKNITLINSSFSWYIVLRDFLENNNKKIELDADLPLFNGIISYKGWEGNFFNKDNPLWGEVFEQKRSFYPSKENLERVYREWKRFSKVSK
ncbi:DNA sulfur modification protein DndB [Bacillus infantis]|uniref:DNA sulfur modification protein DndB n=1 Tax=Bacillus infantis TaxID=324767 RepID=UPI003CF4503C